MYAKLAGRAMWVAGADGCPAGWLAVFRSTVGELPHARIFPTFAELVATEPATIAVDIPVGLPKVSRRGGRHADQEARKRLGAARQSSVFPAPSRATLRATTFDEACTIEQKHSDPPKKISQQVFNILDKIREVDGLARQHPGLIYECHPEVSFLAMNSGVAMQLPKKVSRRKSPTGISGAGLEERRKHLVQCGYAEEFLTTRIGSAAEHGLDDLIDACAAAWTAERIFRNDGSLIVLPARPDPDEHNVCMAIWA